MFGLEGLDVALGLMLVYLVLSLICTAITEGVGQLFRWRGRNLRAAIRRLIGGELCECVYSDPLIAALQKNRLGCGYLGYSNQWQVHWREAPN